MSVRNIVWQGFERLKRWTWAPVGGRSAPRPDHHAYFKANGAPCCAWHDRQFERTARRV